jgi:formylglycine-generating enzyme required for sulfatase activity
MNYKGAVEKMRYYILIVTLVLLSVFSHAQGDFDDSPVINLNLDVKSLTVTSAFGSPLPSGTTYYLSGSKINPSVEDTIFDDSAERWVCSGWIGTGSVPSVGSEYQFSFNITLDSILSWTWVLPPLWEKVNYFLLGKIILTQAEKIELDANYDQKIDIADSITLIPKPTPTPHMFEFVKIPAGSFEMGAENDDPGWTYANTEPVHTVTFDYDFYMTKYEVTQHQWEEIMGSNPAEQEYGIGDDLPVYNITWEECQSFIVELNKLGEGTYRLPSEAEWEYACRGPAANPHRYSRFSFGDTTCAPKGDSCSELSQYAWWKGNNGNPGTKNYGVKQVGLKLPNPWGLYDMHGNVMEWCQDTFHVDYTGAPGDGSAWVSTDDERRMFRGGGWNHYPMNCQTAFRNSLYPNEKRNTIGIRLVKEIP